MQVRKVLIWFFMFFSAANAFSVVQTNSRRLPPHIVSSSQALFSSFNNNNNKNDDSSFFGGLKKAAKKVLPSVFENEEERKARLVKKQTKDEINALFKDAPLPLRMATRMMAPLISNSMSMLQEGMAEQQKSVENTLEQAQVCLQQDPSVMESISGNIVSLQVVSQSSSSSSINGQTTQRVQLVCQVLGGGSAQIMSVNGHLQDLVYMAPNGKRMNVRTTPRSGGGGASSSWGRNDGDGDILDAEIVEKRNN